MTWFARTQREVPGWFWAGKAAALRRGRPRPLDLEGFPLVLWRDAQGHPVAMDRRCAHLGADLSQGRITPEGLLECPFHHWCFDAQGVCRKGPFPHPPQRRLSHYPVLERWGQLWVFLGPEPLFPLPGVDEPGQKVLHIGPVRMKCHPHLCLANGVDGQHFRCLHPLEFDAEPEYEQLGPYHLVNRMWTRFRKPWMKWLMGDLHPFAEFHTFGANVGWLSVSGGPHRFAILFNGHLRPGGHTDNHMFMFLFRPWPSNLRFMLTVLPNLLSDDQRILERLQFHPGFVPGVDDGLIGLAAVVDRLVSESERSGSGGA